MPAMIIYIACALHLLDSAQHQNETIQRPEFKRKHIFDNVLVLDFTATRLLSIAKANGRAVSSTGARMYTETHTIK